jgi:A/G-specific adenine glycosylase
LPRKTASSKDEDALRECKDALRRLVYQNYRQHGRRFPWRETKDPYHILVSEIMLQQTQTERALVKYPEFVARFPDCASLARADLRDVLVVWKGLGYNRRALALRRIAERVESEFGGILPDCEEELRAFPCIGAATAGAIQAFAFDKPAVFVETNIRRVFIHFFFPHTEQVRDREILPLVEQTLDKQRVRSWYYALMDYGAMLRSRGENPNRRSAHYARQSPFGPSKRRIRGLIIGALVEARVLAVTDLVRDLGISMSLVEPILEELIREGFVKRIEDSLTIPSELPGE